MPRAKRKGDPPKSFETGNEKTGFIRIYKDLFLSEAYGSLSQPARDLYCSMLCARYNQGRAEKAELAEKFGNSDFSYFYFNQDKWIKAGHKRDIHHFNLFSKWESFRKYRDELLDAGFVEIVEANGHRMKKNIYRFSDKWKRSGNK